MPGAPEGIGLTKKKIPALGGSSTQIVGSCFPRPAVFPVGLKLSDHRKEVESALRAWDGAGGGGGGGSGLRPEKGQNQVEPSLGKPERQHHTVEREVLEFSRHGRASGFPSV